MKKRVSSRELEDLRGSGAKVTVSRKPEREDPAPVPAGPTPVEAAMFELASTMSYSQRAIAAQIAETLERSNTTKPTAFRFTIKRDKRGLIESMDAIPINTV